MTWGRGGVIGRDWRVASRIRNQSWRKRQDGHGCQAGRIRMRGETL